MRRFLAIVAALALAALPARADFGAGGHLLGFWVGGVSPLTATHIGHNQSASNLADYTYTNEPIGAASPDRIVVVAAAGFDTANGAQLDAVTIEGNAATCTIDETINISTGSFGAGVCWLLVPTGTDADIVVSFDQVMVQNGIMIWTITGSASASVLDSYVDNTLSSGAFSISMSTGIEGNAVVGAVTGGSFSADWTAYAWSGLTEESGCDFEEDAAVNTQDSCASLTQLAPTSGTVSTTRTGGGGTEGGILMVLRFKP